jgi:hypothetical protein
MLSPDEELQSRSGCDDVPRPCRNCDHDSTHGKYGCEHERGDSWVTGNQESQPTVLMAMGPCGCTNYEPTEESDGND